MQAAAEQLSYRLGPGVPYELAIRYDRLLDPALDLPSGADCVDRLNVIMAQSEIGFEPSSSTIAGDAGPTLSQLAQAAADCGAFRIEVAGHTDSQGSENSNAELSRSRAQAVLAGRDFVTPDDIREIARPALRHRIALAPELQIEGQDADQVLQALLAKVDAPRT